VGEEVRSTRFLRHFDGLIPSSNYTRYIYNLVILVVAIRIISYSAINIKMRVIFINRTFLHVLLGLALNSLSSP